MAARAEPNVKGWVNRRDYPFEPHHMRVHGGRMHYVDEGKGEPIVFVHGTPTWSFLFREPIKALRSDHRCVAMDHLGFGLSDKPPTFDHLPSSHSRNMGELLDHLGLTDITLVVHDFGGPIGLGWATEHPERVKRIVLINTWLWDLRNDPAARKVGALAGSPLGKFLYLRANLSPKLVKPLFADKKRYTEAVHDAYFGPFRRKEDRSGPCAFAHHLLGSGPWYDELWDCLEAFEETPKMLLWGLKDRTFSQRYLNHWVTRFPMAQVKTVPDAGHFLVEERPEAVVQALREFVRTPSPSSSPT